MLTRKHFNAAAAGIRKGKTLQLRRKGTADFLRFMRATKSVNPRFDRARFKKAAGSDQRPKFSFQKKTAAKLRKAQ